MYSFETSTDTTAAQAPPDLYHTDTTPVQVLRPSINHTKPIETTQTIQTGVYTAQENTEAGVLPSGHRPEDKKKVAPKKKDQAGPIKAGKDQLFSESPYADKAVFKEAFAHTEYEAANLDYYHEVISNWSQSKGTRKKDWIATAKNWMLNDYKEGKLLTKQTPPHGKTTIAPHQSAGNGVDLDALFALIDHAHPPKQ